MHKHLLILFLFILSTGFAQNFVTIDGTQFKIKNKPYNFIGTNFWYGMNIGSKGSGGDRIRLIKELDFLQSIGVNNLRIMAGSEGPDDAPWRMKPSLQKAPGKYNQDILDGLDFLISEMAKRKMYAVVCLNNFWQWSGGMSQYVSWANGNENIPYPPPQEKGDWVKYMRYTAEFYKNKKAQKLFENHISFLLKRVNSYTGKQYINDPTIMSWELANEPVALQHKRPYRAWINTTAKFIKNLDPNHLVTIGSEGNTNKPKFTKNNAYKDGRSKYIDYLTIHIWIQNWNWYKPKKHEQTFSKALLKTEKYIAKHLEIAKKLNKPLVLEEFGISRDQNDHDPSASTLHRDLYYKRIFEIVTENISKKTPLQGANFWAWAGFGKPKNPTSYWQKNDAYIGDPPHELQGWYSVYYDDHSTIELIKKFNNLIDN